MRAREKLPSVRTGLFALATLFAVTCTAEPPPPIGVVEQAVINPPLPSNLSLILHAKTTVTIGEFTQVNGDIGSSGVNGTVLFQSGSEQNVFANTLANTIKVLVGAQAGHLLGNDITVEGSRASLTLGLDPTALPPVPDVTVATPGTTNVSVAANQTKQLCAGQYGAMTLGRNSTLNLNGGIYHLTRLNLAEGASLEPSEPVVLLISGNMITGVGSAVTPSPQSIGFMSADTIRIEVGGNITIGDSNSVRAHLLAPNGKLTTGRNTTFTGAGWAKSIVLGPQGVVNGEGFFSGQTLPVPPPCNDNSACTVDECVSGVTSFCRNTPVPDGSSCEDGNVCNGAEVCNDTGVCQPGTILSAGTSCANENQCDGDEVCNGTGFCLAGSPPVLSDREPCTVDTCDPLAGVSHTPLPDGSVCPRTRPQDTGFCQAGICSIPGLAFSEDFVFFDTPFEQCDRWNAYLLHQLDFNPYQSITVSGTFDPVGVTCTDPGAASDICHVLHDDIIFPFSIACDGHTWNVGLCGGVELTVDTPPCACNTGRVVRPCIGNPNWGGVNTETCGAPSQSITVVCE